MLSPDFALFSLTYNCSNRCVWCYASPERFADKGMTKEETQKYIDLCASLGIKDIGLLGGEPTLFPWLFEIIEYANGKGLRSTLYTNGRKLSDDGFVRKLKESGVYCVNIGIQGPDAESHDKVTRAPGSFAETVRGIENCARHGLNTRLLCVLSRDDFESYRKTIEKFSAFTKLFVFFRELPTVEHFEKQNVLSNEKTARLATRLYEYAKVKGVCVSIYIRMPLCFLPERLASDMARGNALENFCHITEGMALNIDTDGRVQPCVNWTGVTMLSLKKEDGSIMEKGEFLAQWNSGEINKSRNKLKKLPAKECANCRACGTYCTGGCPLVKFGLGPYWKEYQNLSKHNV